MKDRLGMGLPLTSPAIPAFVHPRRACSCTSCSFGFCRAPHSHSETRYSVSLPQPSHFFLHFSLLSRLFLFLSLFLANLLSAPSSFLASFLSFPSLSFPTLTTSPLFLLGLSPPLLFCPPDHGFPARPACLWSASVFLCIASRSSLRLPTL